MSEPDRKSASAGEVADEALAGLPAPTFRETFEQPPRTPEERATDEVPLEYRGALISDAVLGALRQARDQSHRTVLLAGKPGTGKTHQVWGAYWRIMVNCLRSAHPMTAISKMGHAYPRGSMRVITEAIDIERNRYDHAWLDCAIDHQGWLAVDDIGYARAPSEWVVMAIYNIANRRRAQQLPTLWTTNLEPAKLKEYYTPAIASRLLGGCVLQLDGQDKRV